MFTGFVNGVACAVCVEGVQTFTFCLSSLSVVDVPPAHFKEVSLPQTRAGRYDRNSIFFFVCRCDNIIPQYHKTVVLHSKPDSSSFHSIAM